MKNSMRFGGLFLAALVLLPGCMHVPTYRRKALKSVSDHCTYRGSEKNVIMRAKQLRNAEKSYLFGNRSALLGDDELQAIYISLHNLSDASYVFSCDNIYVKQMHYHDVSRSMKKTSSMSRLAGGVLLVTPLPILVAVTLACSSVAIVGAQIAIIPAMIIGGMVGAVVGIPLVAVGFGLAFFAQGIKSIVMNTRIRKDFAEKVLHEPIVISSGGQYEGLIFVKSSDYTPQFAVTMHEKDNAQNSITFDVDLRQNEKQDRIL